MTTVTGTDDDARSRRRSLTEAIAELRVPRMNVSLETVFLTVGALLLPIGLVVIILGWYGAAHTGHIYEQNSYIISGGVLGLGLIFVGFALYVGYWMTRQIRATETGTQQTLRALRQLQEELRTVGVEGEAPAEADVFVATEHGSMLHRPTCQAVAGRKVHVVDDRSAAKYRACSICIAE
ncbi:MAG: hypothetical protein JO086_03060 [Acidimicrobiia bacterium]|nr:hypothetical protein [Acidimicrobiia bacterium]